MAPHAPILRLQFLPLHQFFKHILDQILRTHVYAGRALHHG